MALSREQQRIAKTILDVGRKYTKSRKVLVAGLEAGLVESNLSNVNYGDRDSLGVFQQRPSQGWGSPQQVRDVRYAAAQFFKRAAPLEGKYGTAGELAQAVQRSAFPGRYNQRRGEALGIYKSLGGKGGGRSKAPGNSRRGDKVDAASVRSIRGDMAKNKKGKKKSKAPATSSDRFAQQAQLATEVRYGGEKRALARALEDAEQNLQVRSALEDSAARGTISTLESSKPKLIKGYSDAQFSGMQNYQDVQKVLEKLGGSADVFKAITAREEGGRQNRISEAVTNALAETERRKAQAQSGATYGKRAAMQQRDSDVAKVNQRLADIESEAGAFTAATYGSALEKQRDRNTKVKLANLSAAQKEADRKARLYTARLKEAGLSDRQAEKISADWKREVMKQEQQNARTAATNATSLAKGGGTKGKSKPPTEGELTKRSQILKVRDIYRAGIAKGQPLSKLAKKARAAGIPNEMVAAGADLATKGYVLPGNRQALKSVLGVRSPGEWRKPPKGFKAPARPKWPTGF